MIRLLKINIFISAALTFAMVVSGCIKKPVQQMDSNQLVNQNANVNQNTNTATATPDHLNSNQYIQNNQPLLLNNTSAAETVINHNNSKNNPESMAQNVGKENASEINNKSSSYRETRENSNTSTDIRNHISVQNISGTSTQVLNTVDETICSDTPDLPVDYFKDEFGNDVYCQSGLFFTLLPVSFLSRQDLSSIEMFKFTLESKISDYFINHIYLGINDAPKIYFDNVKLHVDNSNVFTPYYAENTASGDIKKYSIDGKPNSFGILFKQGFKLSKGSHSFLLIGDGWRNDWRAIADYVYERGPVTATLVINYTNLSTGESSRIFLNFAYLNNLSK